MKINLKYLFLFSFLPYTLAVNASEDSYYQEEVESLKVQEYLKSIQKINVQIEENKDQIETTKNLIEQNNKEIEYISAEIEQLRADIESLRLHSQDIFSNEVQQLSDQLNQLKNYMVEMSINFLATPYDEYCIEEVAIPYFEKGKGSPYYEKYKYRGEMLTHYRQDWDAVKKFLEENKNTTYSTAGTVKDKLLNLVTYIQYVGGKINPKTRNFIPGYGDNWENTYLGQIMSDLLTVLSGAAKPDDDDKIKDVFKKCLKKMN